MLLKTLIFDICRVENIVGKGENAGYQHYLFFHQMLMLFFFLRDIKGCPLCSKLPKNKILGWSKLKTFADYKKKKLKMMTFMFDRVETLWEKEKMLVTSIFSFPLNVFKRRFIQGR